ncbi:MAG: chemotaxis protein CheD [Syntrophotaleaceae bacterium]
MKDIILGIGDYGASNSPGSTVKTFALGSCVAVIVLDPKTHTVGMVHVALPDSSINEAKGRERPGYFADLGVPLLLKEMTRCGAPSNGRGLVVKLVGGASIMDHSETFNIGKRNVLAIKKMLWSFGMGPLAEDVGGNHSRTVTVAVDTGKVVVSCPGRGQWEV